MLPGAGNHGAAGVRRANVSLGLGHGCIVKLAWTCSKHQPKRQAASRSNYGNFTGTTAHGLRYEYSVAGADFMPDRDDICFMFVFRATVTM